MYPFNFVRLISGQYIVDLREKTFIRKDEDIEAEIFDYLLKYKERDITESDIPYLSKIAEVPVHKLDEDSLISLVIQQHLARWNIQGG